MADSQHPRYEWRFVEATFACFHDDRPWTRFVVGELSHINEAADGPCASIPQFAYDTMEADLRRQKSVWQRDSKRTMLIRFRVPEDK